MNAKTRQKHDYPSAAWRRSYARRTGAERGFATVKDPASNDISRGWCRLMGLAPLMLFTTALLAVRNQRILHAWNARQEENQYRAANGLPPKTPAQAPQDPRRNRRHRAALTPRARPGNTATAASTHRTQTAAACPETSPGQHKNSQANTNRTRHGARQRARECRDPNQRKKKLSSGAGCLGPSRTGL